MIRAFTRHGRMTHEINIADKIKAAMPSFIDCLNAFVLTGVFVFLLAALTVVADGSGAPATPDGALVNGAASVSALSGFDHLAGEAK